jgi:integrase
MARKSGCTLRAENSKGRTGYRLRFQVRPKERKSIWLGNETEAVARTWLNHVNAILVTRSDKMPPPAATLAWIASLEPDYLKKLEIAGLVAPSSPAKPTLPPAPEPPKTLDFLLERFMKTVGRKKPATVEKLEQAGEILKKFFGGDRILTSITPGDAREWADWLATNGNTRDSNRSDLAKNTVRRKSGLVKQIFNHAVDLRLIADNPFTRLPCSVGRNEERMTFVSHETIERVIEAAPDASWRAIVALARYGGLRIPSELERMTWKDVNFAIGLVHVYSVKTEHHEGKSERYLPLFDELRPYMEDLAIQAKAEGRAGLDDKVFPNITSASNLRTGLIRMIKKSGVGQWEKLFQNLRASRETELMEGGVSIHKVCQWLGNSPAIALRHYALPSTDRAKMAEAAKDAGVDGVQRPAGKSGPHTIGGPFGGPFGGTGRQHLATSPETEVGRKPKKSQGKEGELATAGSDRHSSATTSEIPKNGRRGTRTPDIHFVRVAL